jgi:hypothetical protein
MNLNILLFIVKHFEMHKNNNNTTMIIVHVLSLNTYNKHYNNTFKLS